MNFMERSTQCRNLFKKWEKGNFRSTSFVEILLVGNNFLNERKEGYMVTNLVLVFFIEGSA